MSIESRIDSIENKFNSHKDWEDKYRVLIKFGKQLEEVDRETQVPKYEIKGCQSKVWLRPKLNEGLVYFIADSDAILVKGIIGVLMDVYSGSSPDEILSNPPSFLSTIGISEHLSLNRTNGLRAMVKQIQTYASLFQALVEKGVMNADI